jgi:hypothetical protein
VVGFTTVSRGEVPGIKKPVTRDDDDDDNNNNNNNKHCETAGYHCVDHLVGDSTM